MSYLELFDSKFIFIYFWKFTFFSPNYTYFHVNIWTIETNNWTPKVIPLFQRPVRPVLVLSMTKLSIESPIYHFLETTI